MEVSGSLLSVRLKSAGVAKLVLGSLAYEDIWFRHRILRSSSSTGSSAASTVPPQQVYGSSNFKSSALLTLAN
ncbi:hypothetical protein M0R45_034142 [Rubus argutus]|uniref:Uncharacterized protein n=1 Tax=Rubus argutus TaxID=59490 RepID=A0AAW1VRQ0_RUBAR